MRLIRPAWDNSERYRELSCRARASSASASASTSASSRRAPTGDGAVAAEELRRHLTVTANLVAEQLGVARRSSAGGYRLAHFRKICIGRVASGSPPVAVTSQVSCM